VQVVLRSEEGGDGDGMAEGRARIEGGDEQRPDSVQRREKWILSWAASIPGL
jgi:hypothetical protein